MTITRVKDPQLKITHKGTQKPPHYVVYYTVTVLSVKVLS
jgi:hypothetical protein